MKWIIYLQLRGKLVGPNVHIYGTDYRVDIAVWKLGFRKVKQHAR